MKNLELLTGWFEKTVLKTDIEIGSDNVIQMKNSVEWQPLVPAYDYLKLEQDFKVNHEYAQLGYGSMFNEHGLGFDLHGNELNLLKKETHHDEL